MQIRKFHIQIIQSRLETKGMFTIIELYLEYKINEQLSS